MEPDLIDDLAGFLSAAGIDTAVIDRVVLKARKQFGGGAVYVKKIERNGRNAAIKKSFASGASKSEISRSFKISIKTVRRIINS